jgi:uncharacterized protein YgbK (DUF1537 family)
MAEKAWNERAASQLAQAGRLLIGIGDEPPVDAAGELLPQLAGEVVQVLRGTPAATLLIEGGATASAIVQRLGWTRFVVTQDAPAGVGVLRPVGTHAPLQMLIKPGSYPWPGAVWTRLGRTSDD